jgi:hypothetical protein
LRASDQQERRADHLRDNAARVRLDDLPAVAEVNLRFEFQDERS